MRLIAILLLAFFIAGCGYKPSSVAARDAIGSSVWVDVIISKTDPESTVVIKDGIKSAMLRRLGVNLVDKNEADSIIIASIKSLTFSAISYDQFGYATAYKANLVMEYRLKQKDVSIKSILTSGDYDFRVTKRLNDRRFTDSVISDNERFDAITNASLQCFDEFVSKLAMQGLLNGKPNL
ncbi:LPS assembly lipoprotein LptE [Campylobacter devanensis]|uniref:LPS assembly lipoprotein LptE n=1 Tax=Campylobacter devanensis TaxID=3161138 RepID=UPI000A34CBC0|nr:MULTISPECIES: LPS assembly lipoprotein LptE [unclassified Campylobacter]